MGPKAHNVTLPHSENPFHNKLILPDTTHKPPKISSHAPKKLIITMRPKNLARYPKGPQTWGTHFNTPVPTHWSLISFSANYIKMKWVKIGGSGLRPLTVSDRKFLKYARSTHSVNTRFTWLPVEYSTQMFWIKIQYMPQDLWPVGSIQ